MQSVGTYVVKQHLTGCKRYPAVLMLEPLFRCNLPGAGCGKIDSPVEMRRRSTDWDKYGTGNYEKCADCMVHSGCEATAVVDAVTSPLKTTTVALRGPRTTEAMAAEIPLTNQWPAEYVFSRHVQEKMAELKRKPRVADVADAD